MDSSTHFINDDRLKLFESLLPKPIRSTKDGRPLVDNRQVLLDIL